MQAGEEAEEDDAGSAAEEDAEEEQDSEDEMIAHKKQLEMLKKSDPGTYYSLRLLCFYFHPYFF